MMDKEIWEAFADVRSRISRIEMRWDSIKDVISWILAAVLIFGMLALGIVIGLSIR